MIFYPVKCSPVPKKSPQRDLGPGSPAAFSNGPLPDAPFPRLMWPSSSINTGDTLQNNPPSSSSSGPNALPFDARLPAADIISRSRESHHSVLVFTAPSAMSVEEKETEDWAFKAFGPEPGIELVKRYDPVPDYPVNLFALARQSRICVAAGSESIVIASADSLENALASNAKEIDSIAKISHEGTLLVEILANEKQVAVYDSREFLTVYTLPDGEKSWSIEVPGIVALNARPGSSGGLAYATEEKKVCIVDTDGTTTNVGTGISCAWAPDGTILAYIDGKNVHTTDGKAYEAPSDIKFVAFIDQGTLFAVLDSEDEYSVSYLELGTNTWKSVSEACPPWGDESRQFAFYLSRIAPNNPSWNVFVAAASQSTNVLLASAHNILVTDESKAAVLPYTESDTSPTGIVVDVSPSLSTPSPFGNSEQTLTTPIVLVLTNEGAIVGWHLAAKSDSPSPEAPVTASDLLQKPKPSESTADTVSPDAEVTTTNNDEKEESQATANDTKGSPELKKLQTQIEEPLKERKGEEPNVHEPAAESQVEEPLNTSPTAEPDNEEHRGQETETDANALLPIENESPSQGADSDGIKAAPEASASENDAVDEAEPSRPVSSAESDSSIGLASSPDAVSSPGFKSISASGSFGDQSTFISPDEHSAPGSSGSHSALNSAGAQGAVNTKSEVPDSNDVAKPSPFAMGSSTFGSSWGSKTSAFGSSAQPLAGANGGFSFGGQQSNFGQSQSNSGAPSSSPFASSGSTVKAGVGFAQFAQSAPLGQNQTKASVPAFATNPTGTSSRSGDVFADFAKSEKKVGGQAGESDSPFAKLSSFSLSKKDPSADTKPFAQFGLPSAPSEAAATKPKTDSTSTSSSFAQTLHSREADSGEPMLGKLGLHGDSHEKLKQDQPTSKPLFGGLTAKTGFGLSSDKPAESPFAKLSENKEAPSLGSGSASKPSLGLSNSSSASPFTSWEPKKNNDAKADGQEKASFSFGTAGPSAQSPLSSLSLNKKPASDSEQQSEANLPKPALSPFDSKSSSFSALNIGKETPASSSAFASKQSFGTEAKPSSLFGGSGITTSQFGGTKLGTSAPQDPEKSSQAASSSSISSNMTNTSHGTPFDHKSTSADKGGLNRAGGSDASKGGLHSAISDRERVSPIEPATAPKSPKGQEKPVPPPAHLESLTWDSKGTQTESRLPFEPLSDDGLELSCLDLVYVQTNSLFRVVNHNLLCEAELNSKETPAAPQIENIDSWRVEDSDQVNDELVKLKEQIANMGAETTGGLSEARALTSKLSQSLADLRYLAEAIELLSASNSKDALLPRPMPLRAVQLKRSIRQRFSQVNELLKDAEGDAVVARARSTGQLNMPNLSAAVESLSQRVSLQKNKFDGIVARLDCLSESSLSPAASLLVVDPSRFWQTQEAHARTKSLTARLRSRKVPAA